VMVPYLFSVFAAFREGSSPLPNGPRATAVYSSKVKENVLEGGEKELMLESEAQEPLHRLEMVHSSCQAGMPCEVTWAVGRKKTLENPYYLIPNAVRVTICPYKPTTPTPSSNASDKSSSKASEVGDEVAGDFVVGERVWVNGVKPGVIAYLGETQFSPGQWAGVVLNDLLGKNDGSVNGVRYFECQPLQGIFTRPSKLMRQPNGDGSEDPLNIHLQGGIGASGQRVIMPLREGILNNSVKTGNESGSNMSDSGSVKKGGEKDLKVGDRVLKVHTVIFIVLKSKVTASNLTNALPEEKVGGTKTGAVRYVGETDFAKGEWCGVELDEPLGKNDGAVAGT
ncbi:hypothetical protein DNTS_025810, partial [Danionella cerebrum]